MAELRHIAIATRDPWLTAEFYKTLFGFEVAGETDSSLAEGVFLTDGIFGMALLDFKSEKAAQGRGKDFVGFHHFGIWVDDIEGTLEAYRAPWRKLADGRARLPPERAIRGEIPRHQRRDPRPRP